MRQLEKLLMCYSESVTCQLREIAHQEDIKMQQHNNDSNTLAHTKWNCKYHIVFAPKYRRKVFYEEKRVEIREILRQLCAWKGVEIVEGEICPDHIHLLLSIPPKMSVSGFMGEGEEQFDDIPEIWEPEVCIPKPRILVPWLLRRHDGKEHGCNKSLYPKPTKS